MKVTALPSIGASLFLLAGVAAIAAVRPAPPPATVDAGLLARVVVTASALPAGPEAAAARAEKPGHKAALGNGLTSAS